MKAELLSGHGSWRSVADSANLTVDIEPGTKEPSDKWKMRMLLSEHSPIRKLTFDIVLHDVMSWVSVHLVRHKIGIEHFVRSQRTDRTGLDRNKLPQDSLVNHEIVLNAQALITISRKRLCNQASLETQQAWQAVIAEVEKTDFLLAHACVPDCIYRGWCYEMKSCGFHQTEAYQKALANYRMLPDFTTINEVKK